MYEEIMLAGFGGQGIMLTGKLLAYAGMEENKEVIWIPSYGPEMRGGTAYCNVVIADRPIGSPIIKHPQSCVVMNRPSLDKFGPTVRPKGLLIINSSLIDVSTDREDIDVIAIPANQIAIDAGSGRAANMVVLGAYMAQRDVLGMESVRQVLKKTFASKPNVLEINETALEEGYKYGRESLSPRKT